MRTLEQLRSQDFAASLDFFGETTTDQRQVERVVAGYREAAAAVADLAGDVYLEVVPSHLGIDISVDMFRHYAAEIVSALPRGSRLQLSAEESRRTDRIINGCLALARDGAPVQVTLQANLRRSPHDADRLIEAGIPVRIVKGAYVEAPDMALPWGDPTDAAFAQLVHKISAAGVQVAIGTHDPVLRERLLATASNLRVEMLLGVRPDDAIDLVRRGHQVRIYVAYGDGWFRYWLRRVAESRGA